MTAELYWLTLTALMTALLWLPYVLNRIVVRGLFAALANPSAEDAPHSAWAERAILAHKNAVEYLVVFAALVLTANAAGVTGGLIATAAMIYFFTRLAHYLIFVFGIPGLRTLSFAASWMCILAIAFTLLGAA